MKLIRVDGENFRLMLLRAFALPLVLMGLLAAVLLWQINALLSEHGWLLHTDNVIATAYNAEKNRPRHADGKARLSSHGRQVFPSTLRAGAGDDQSYLR